MSDAFERNLQFLINNDATHEHTFFYFLFSISKKTTITFLEFLRQRFYKQQSHNLNFYKRGYQAVTQNFLMLTTTTPDAAKCRESLFMSDFKKTKVIAPHEAIRF